MLQYLSVGIPAVVSRVGMNKEVLSKWGVDLGADSTEEWYEALSSLATNEPSRERAGRTGRKLIEQVYSTTVICDQLGKVLLGVLGQRA
jgi:glycosyltransferase involved in cell wall biosynthesis